MTLFSKASVYHEANDNYYISGDAKKEYDFEKFPPLTDLIKKPATLMLIYICIGQYNI